MPLRDEEMWLPGAGMTSGTERRVARAVEEYDPELILGQRRDTGEWCVFLPGRPSSDGQPFPVLTFGAELPAPDKVKAFLYHHDIRRNGRELLDQLDRHYEAEQKVFSDRTSEAAEQVAEAIVSNMEMQGTHPFPSFRMGGKYKKGHSRSSG